MSTVRIYHGDCLEVLATLPAASIDACVTDPPYGIGFMGHEWDQPGKQGKSNGNITKFGRGHYDQSASPSMVAGEYDRSLRAMRQFQEWTEGWAREVFRVLKPGSHILVCGAPRSHHRMICGLEDAGFEIRDCLAWLFGQGFPKSLNLGEGLGTALKPAHEPIVLARKPFRGSVAANVQQYGTGALNIDACRIVFDGDAPTGGGCRESWREMEGRADRQPHNGGNVTHDLGRWPANVCLDERAALVLDEQSGELTSGDLLPGHRRGSGVTSYDGGGGIIERQYGGDSGGASRFFKVCPPIELDQPRFLYSPKPSRDERDQGCDGLEAHTPGACTDRADGSDGLNSPRAGAGRTGGGRNYHPTVKPIELMRWLVKLITPINGTVIDPFLGSGTTGMACRYEMRHFIGIEREAEYIQIAERRIAAVAPLFAEPAQVKESDDAALLVGSLLDLA